MIGAVVVSQGIAIYGRLVPGWLSGFSAGLLLGHFELTVELAPVTWMVSFDYGEPALAVTATVGGIVPLTLCLADHLHRLASILSKARRRAKAMR